MRSLPAFAKPMRQPPAHGRTHAQGGSARSGDVCGLPRQRPGICRPGISCPGTSRPAVPREVPACGAGTARTARCRSVPVPQFRARRLPPLSRLRSSGRSGPPISRRGPDCGSPHGNPLLAATGRACRSAGFRTTPSLVSRNTRAFDKHVDPATAQHRKIVSPPSLGTCSIRSAIRLFCAATEAAHEFI